MPNETQNLPAVNYYSPVEVVGLYRKYLDKGSTNNVVWIRGIYIQRPNQNPQWSAFYDGLRDPDNTNQSITLKINRQDRAKLKSNSLVHIGCKQKSAMALRQESLHMMVSSDGFPSV